MKLNKLALLVVFILLLSCNTSEKISHSFFVAGHTYGKGARSSYDSIGLHYPFRKKFDLISKDPNMKFGVLTGDIVVRNEVNRWDSVKSDIKKMGCKVYGARGNHDGNAANFESIFNPLYHSFYENEDLFIILDPNLDHWNISGEQLDFLKKIIQENKAKDNNIFVFVHQVIWWSKDNVFKELIPNSLESRDEKINFWSEVEPLFSSLENQVFFFAGDVGAFTTKGDPLIKEFSYYKDKNITYITSGMGGGIRDNFVIVDVKKNKEVEFRLIALNGPDNALGELTSYKMPSKN